MEIDHNLFIIIIAEFDMSHAQREHISTVQHFKPSLQSLRLRLCPTSLSEDSFWKIYFALLHPKLNKHDSELLSTCQARNLLLVFHK